MRTITLTIADDVTDVDALAAVVKVVDKRPLGIKGEWYMNFIGGIFVEAIAYAQGDAFLVQRGVK